jgi:hypothetical protein
MNQLLPHPRHSGSRTCRRVRPCASYCFLEFFTAEIRDSHTRAATECFDRLAAKGVTQLGDITSIQVATYIE